MKNAIEKDKHRREFYKKKEKKRKNLSFLLREECLNLAKKIVISQKLREICKDSSITRLRNRCALTGRGRGVSQNYKLSRIKLRE